MSGAATMSPQDFAATTGVSRETLARLEAYGELLRKWQRRINLVAPDTLPDLWRRHMLDSAQLFPLLPPGPGAVLDLGAGAGFPGLVLAAMGAAPVHLVESDARKAAFLREAARVMGVAVTVHNRRIEDVAPFAVRAVVARALAPLPRLLQLAAPFLAQGGVALFPKGARVDEELTAAHEGWNISLERVPSQTDATGVILRIEGIQRRGSEHS